MLKSGVKAMVDHWTPAPRKYCRNLIFKRHFPIRRLFERSCELGLWRLTAHKISEIFGQRLHDTVSGPSTAVASKIDPYRAMSWLAEELPESEQAHRTLATRCIKDVIDNASSYCAPFYVIRTPGFFGRDLLLADGAVRSPIDPK